MRRLCAYRWWLVLALSVAGAGVTAAQAPPSPPIASDLFETIDKAAVTVPLFSGGNRSGDMIITHYRPPGAGPFPLVIMSHGRAGKPEDRAKPERQRFLRVARYWVANGYAVIVPTRLGYGATGVEPDTEASGPCDNRNFTIMADASSRQVLAAIAFGAKLPFVDRQRIILMGQSVGGLATTITAGKNPPGVIAAINVAGGSGGFPDTRPGNPCGPERLARVFAAAGATAKVPMLWLYAENDKFWGTRVPRAWHAAFTAKGAPATFVMVPPVGEDGHRMIDTVAAWKPHVDAFVAALKPTAN